MFTTTPTYLGNYQGSEEKRVLVTDSRQWAKRYVVLKTRLVVYVPRVSACVLSSSVCVCVCKVERVCLCKFERACVLSSSVLRWCVCRVGAFVCVKFECVCVCVYQIQVCLCCI